MIESASTAKASADDAFRSADYNRAIDEYSKAVNVLRKQKVASGSVEEQLLCAILKNRAQAALLLERNEEALNDCDEVLGMVSNDYKAVYRKMKALDQLGRFHEAYKEGLKLISAQPKNMDVQQLMKKLSTKLQKHVVENDSTQGKLQQMLQLAFSEDADVEKRVKALNNLVVLLRENGVCEIVSQKHADSVNKMVNMMIDPSTPTLIAENVTHVLDQFVIKSKSRSMQMYQIAGCKKLCVAMGSENETVATAASHILQMMISYGAGVEAHREKLANHEHKRQLHGAAGLGPPPKYSPDGPTRAVLDELYHYVTLMIDSNKISAFGRDCVMELIIKNFTRLEGVGWYTLMTSEDPTVSFDFIHRCLNVCASSRSMGTIAGTVKVTDNSPMHASLLLARIYDDLVGDKERERFHKQCTLYFQELFADNNMDSKLEAVNCMAYLLQGPYEVGQVVLGAPGVFDLILAMAGYHEQPVTQKVAVECLVHAVGKRKQAQSIIKRAVPILKEVYEKATDEVRVRALVGMCKLASIGGDDASAKSMTDGAGVSLAKACRGFLKMAVSENKSKLSGDASSARWAAEGLAYLTFDGDIKQQLMEDRAALDAMMSLVRGDAKTVRVSSVYAVASTLCNLMNCYDKKEISAEMRQLAKFAKHHVPEQHEFDDDEHIKARVRRLVTEYGLCNALYVLAEKAEMDNAREQVARMYRKVAETAEYRGQLIASGGGKALCRLAKEGSSATAKQIAAQALAKAILTQDPTIALPGSRSTDCVPPLLRLLHPDGDGSLIYDALMALTNLASTTDSVRRSILKDKGFLNVEQWTYDDNWMIKRAAFELLCNLCMVMNVGESEREAFLKYYSESDNDRVKYLVLLLGDTIDNGAPFEEEADGGINTGLGQDAPSEEEIRRKMAELQNKKELPNEKVAKDDALKMIYALAGTLALITVDRAVCYKITTVSNWFEHLQKALLHDDAGMRYRAATVFKNLFMADEGVEESADNESGALLKQLVSSPIVEVLTAMTVMKNEEKGPDAKLCQDRAVLCAKQALQYAADKGLLKLTKPLTI